jgi:GT2 family glycosyltransferase
VITVVVLTFNRVHLLRKCVENVLLRTSGATKEIVIWNNASTDGTQEYLESLSEPRIRAVHHATNIGQNAYARALEHSSLPYMIELDDDVINAPQDWDRTLLEAFQRLPHVGFLAANLEDDEHDPAAQMMHHVRPHLYNTVEENGVTLLKGGPTGGGCAITSRELHDVVGGFRQHRKQVFWLEDAAFIADIEKLGYEAAFLKDLRVHHAGGPHYSEQSAEKHAYWIDYAKSQRRKEAVKKVLLHLPFVRRLNARYGWLSAPT